MDTNYVELVEQWQAGALTLKKAAIIASKLEPGIRQVDRDGTVWYEGEVKNTALALEAFYSYEVIVEFLKAVANEMAK